MSTPAKTLARGKFQPFCPCGQPAVKWKGSAWCCAGCDAIEQRLEWAQTGMGKVQPPEQSRHLEETR